MNLPAWLKSPRMAVWSSVGIGVLVIFLAWLSFIASRQWKQNSIQLVERRTQEAANVMATALVRDMQAVQASVLPSCSWEGFASASPTDFLSLVSNAFARYPYPDSFFTWQGRNQPPKATFFIRAGRTPSWIESVRGSELYPVRIAANEKLAATISSDIENSIDQGRQFAAFELSINGIPYEVVAQLSYRDFARQELVRVCGFTVNLAWVREQYFPQMAREVSRIAGSDSGLSLAIVDDHSTNVVGGGRFPLDGPISRRPFLMAFFDPVTVMANQPPEVKNRTWTVIVSAAGDPTFAAAMRGENWSLALTVIAAAVLVGGLVTTAFAVRASAELATMRSDFVSSITHELKTPLAAIRALGDLMTSGRVKTPDMQSHYAGLVVKESKRLARLVDNLLVHARISDATDFYSFENFDVNGLFDHVLSIFHRQLEEAAFNVSIDIPANLPQIHADRSAMELVFENLIDNAIRYSGETKQIEITAAVRDRSVAISVKDSGIGIPPEDIYRVMHKFVRARNAVGSGSGLGLTIVARAVKDHGGTVAIASALSQGTTVTVELPRA